MSISCTTITNPIDHINVSVVTTRNKKVDEDEEEKTTDDEPVIEVDLEVKENKVEPEKIMYPQKTSEEKKKIGTKLVIRLYYT